MPRNPARRLRSRSRRRPQFLQVEYLESRQLLAPIGLDLYTVTSTADDGVGSLRRAIQNADLNTQTDPTGAATPLAITFAIDPTLAGPGGLFTIAVGGSSGLPAITRPNVTIDATRPPNSGPA